jgi:hypothetical protein
MATNDPILVRSFETLEAAAAAVNALVNAGFPHGAIELRVIEDEAGPVQGNFVIGNGRTVHGHKPSPLRTGLDVPYEENFKQVVNRGVHLLLVDTVDAAGRKLAEQILEAAGGVPVLELADAALQR